MSDVNTPGKGFFIIGVAALAWYLFGLVQFLGSLTATQETLQPMIDNGSVTQDYVDFLLATPGWVTALFGVATIGGALASVLLLMRKKLSHPFYVIALAAALIMYLWMFVLSGKASILPGFDYGIAAMVTIISALLVWFTRKKVADGTLI